MSNRINRNIYQNVINSSLGDIDTNWISSGRPYFVYKFRKESGILRMTPAGELGLDTNASTMSQVVNLYSGKEPVVVIWEGSTNLKVDEKDNVIKKYTVGEYYEMYGVCPMSVANQNESISFLSNDFITQFLNKDITLLSKDWIPTDNDVLDFVYMIIDSRARSYQWLEIENYIPNYNEETKSLENVEITFANINLKYASSGKSILDFFQFGAIGEGYAFPTETILTNGQGDKTIRVGYDIKKSLDNGANFLQFDFMSGCALSSVTVYGRETSQETNNENEFMIDKPKRLFLHQSFFPIVSPLFFNQPNSNYFWCEGARSTMSGVWETYKEKAAGNNLLSNYNVGKTKTTIGGLEMTPTKVRNTNPISGGQYSYQLWNNEKIFNLSGNYDFSSVNGIKSADMSKAPPFTICDFLNFNSFVNFSSDVFNYEFNETTKYKLGDVLGVLGSILNIFTGGLDFGWTSIKSLAPSQPMNILFPCVSYEIGMIGISNATALPMEVFSDDKDASVIPIPINVLSSFKFSLTDRILDTSQVRPDKEIGQGREGIWNTKYLGQTKFENGDYINTDKSVFEFNPATTTAIPTPVGTGFLIDYIGFHAVAQSDIKISATQEATDLTTGKQVIKNIYSSLFETISKARKDIRIWGNSMKFNYYDKINTDGIVSWPNQTPLPQPSTTLQLISSTFLSNNIKNFTITKSTIEPEGVATISSIQYKPGSNVIAEQSWGYQGITNMIVNDIDLRTTTQGLFERSGGINSFEEYESFIVESNLNGLISKETINVASWTNRTDDATKEIRYYKIKYLGPRGGADPDENTIVGGSLGDYAARITFSNVPPSNNFSFKQKLKKGPGYLRLIRKYVGSTTYEIVGYTYSVDVVLTLNKSTKTIDIDLKWISPNFVVGSSQRIEDTHFFHNAQGPKPPTLLYGISDVSFKSFYPFGCTLSISNFYLVPKN